MSQSRIFLLAAAAVLHAQQSPGPDEIRVSSQPYVPQSPYTIRVETKLVDMVIAVRDGRGRAVPGLTRDNFQIFDEGKERRIAPFSEDTDASATINLPAGTTAASLPAAKPAEVQPARFLAIL